MVLDEIWKEELYKDFKECKSILDVGGYLGESAVYFHEVCGASVDVYESDKRNMQLLEKNCLPYEGIHSVYGAVTSGHKNYRITYDQIDRWTVGEDGEEVLPTHNFFDILHHTSYEGIKIDIEWGEYEIVDALVDQRTPLHAKVIFIEFHRLQEKSYREKLFTYVRYFINQGYVFTIFDNDNNLVQLTTALSGQLAFVNFLFLKE